MTGTPSLQFYLSESARESGIVFESPKNGDAGFDIRAAENLVLAAGEQALVPTGLKVAIPEGFVGLIRDRSSMAMKRVYSHAGVIDAGYRGEVKIILSNNGTDSYQIECGDKIAQMIVAPFVAESCEVDSEDLLGVTARGEGGFGSTGRS